VWLAGEREDLVAALSAGCTVTGEADFGPFQARQLAHCPVSAATPVAP
jgi:hypothetical protein